MSHLGQRTFRLALLALWLLGAERGLGAEAEGSGLDDQGLEASRTVDERGLSLLVHERRRSPSGVLYPYPYAPPAWTSAGGIDWRGAADVGYFEDRDRQHETRFEEHVDWSDGLLLRDFFLDLRPSESGGAYAHFEGGSAGRDDAFYRAEVGRRGWLRLGLFYDQVPHVQANDARSLFQGVGTESLTLPATLTPGGTGDPAADQAAVDAALLDAGERSLAIQRDRAGASLSLRATPELTLSGFYKRERRTGERPFGGAIFFAFTDSTAGSVIETIEPIDSLTHDFGGGLQYAGKRVQANLTYHGSEFDNSEQSLTWENPFPAGAFVPRGRFALAPSNSSNDVHGDLGVVLPWQGRWTASAAWNRMRQNEELLPGTLNTDYPDWTGVNSLSRRNADALVETRLFDSSLLLRPLRPLTARVHLRYFDRDNQTDYQAFNPVANTYGYVAEDGMFGVIPRFEPVPFDYARALGEASLVWRAPFGTNFELEYKRDEFRREQRARDTWEDTWRASLTSRRLGPATLRVSYAIRDRRGSDYDVTHDAVYYSSGPLDGFADPPTGSPVQSLTDFRQLDLADRLQHELQVRLRLALGPAVDLALAGLVRSADYDSDYGRDFDRGNQFNLELGWQPSPRLELHAFGSAEWRHSKLESINSAPAGPPYNAGSLSFPLANAWSSDAEGDTLGAGLGFRSQVLSWLELSGDYTWLRSRDERDYSYDPLGGALAFGTTPDLAGNGLPTLGTGDQVLRLAAELRLAANWSARLFYRFEHSSLGDPQQEGLVPRIAGRQILYLAHIDEDFNAQVFGGSVKLTF